MYAQDNILCQFGLINLSSVQQLISQPILIHFWWELYHSESEDDEPNDDNSTCDDDDRSFDLSFVVDSEGAHEKVAEFFSHATNASRPKELLLNTYPRYGTSHKKMLEELLIP